MPDPVSFFAITSEEFKRASAAVNPRHANYDCGACGQSTNGRVICEVFRRRDNATIQWALCSCPREEPSVLILQEAKIARQFPDLREFQAEEAWPEDVRRLYDEAAMSFAAGAYTASAMVARKALMVCACLEGACEGESFVRYVDYVVDRVVPVPRVRPAIDRIRTIGNEANHSVAFVGRDEAKVAMQILTYLLNAAYSLPGL